MAGPVSRILARRRRQRTRRRHPAAVGSPTEAQLFARTLCVALDRAIDRGRWEHAQRLAGAILELDPASGEIGTRLARIRLARGEARSALGLIDARPDDAMPDSTRLLRAVCLARSGRGAEARRDLERWSQHPAAPAEARRLQALLEWDTGDEHGATLALLRNLQIQEDPRSLELLLLIAVAQGQDDRAAAWAHRLAANPVRPTASTTEALVRTLVPHIDPTRSSGATDESGAARVERGPGAPPRETVIALAAALHTAERALPALVEAQTRRPDPARSALLEAAIEMARDTLEDHARASESLARLALIRGDVATARRHVAEGLADHPLSAPLTMLARELDASSADRSRAA